MVLLPRTSTRGAEDGCANKDRLGPYATRAEAERALQTAAERNEAWDEDPRWRDD